MMVVHGLSRKHHVLLLLLLLLLLLMKMMQMMQMMLMMLMMLTMLMVEVVMGMALHPDESVHEREMVSGGGRGGPSGVVVGVCGDGVREVTTASRDGTGGVVGRRRRRGRRRGGRGLLLV